MKEKDYPGTFIVVEGADGAGTTTMSERLAEELDAYWTSEPSSGKVGEKVEDMIRSDAYSAEAIALVFAADREVHMEEEVIPRLKEGETVVCDRYYHSSLVYQPVMGADFEWIRELNKGVVRPDLTVILDVGSEKAFSRLKKRESKINPENFEEGNQSSLDMFSFESEVVFEELSFQEKVVRRYRGLEERLDEELFFVDASESKEVVFSDLVDVVDRNC